MDARKIATIQIDVDPFWFITANYKASRSGTNEIKQTIYEAAIPIYLDMFKKHDIKATFFIVGKDLEDKRNFPYIEQILSHNHEIANHSYSHRTDIHHQTLDETRYEIDRFCEVLYRNFKIRPKGFKAPAYNINSFIMNHLKQQGYTYDSSVCPCSAIPMVKLVQRIQYKKDQGAYGNWNSVLANIYPYYPHENDIYKPGNMDILEIPVSTMPVFRLPFHFSFINVGGVGLYRTARIMMHLTGQSFLNYAFHAIDILDINSVPKPIARRPGMQKTTKGKLATAEKILTDIRKHHSIMTTCQVSELYKQLI